VVVVEVEPRTGQERISETMPHPIHDMTHSRPDSGWMDRPSYGIFVHCPEGPSNLSGQVHCHAMAIYALIDGHSSRLSGSLSRPRSTSTTTTVE